MRVISSWREIAISTGANNVLPLSNAAGVGRRDQRPDRTQSTARIERPCTVSAETVRNSWQWS
jgi:hypothetical protein